MSTKETMLTYRKENRVSKIPFEVATSDKPGVSSLASPINLPKSVTKSVPSASGDC